MMEKLTESERPRSERQSTPQEEPIVITVDDRSRRRRRKAARSLPQLLEAVAERPTEPTESELLGSEKRITGVLPARFVAIVFAAAVVFVAVGLFIDLTTDFGTEFPVTANVLAGVLGLPISGIAAAFVVEFLLKDSHRRQWGKVYDHVRKDVLPPVRDLLDRLELGRPGKQEKIRTLGDEVVTGVQSLEAGAHVRPVTKADLPMNLDRAIAESVELLSTASPRPVIDAYDSLETRFADLDLLDDANVKLVLLQLRRSARRIVPPVDDWVL